MSKFDGYLFERSKNPVAVIDIGSSLIKSGLEGSGSEKTGYTGPQFGKTTKQGFPSHILHNAVTPSKSRTNRATSCVCCDLALTHAHAAGESWNNSVAPVQIDQPVTRGRVRDYGQLENVLYHVLHHELECYIPDTPLMLSGKFLSTLNEVNIAPLAEIAFESFGHPSLSFVPPAPLILMSTGRIDGVVLDMGHGATTTAAVVDGKTVPGSVCRVPIGGMDVTSELQTTMITKLAGSDGQSKTPNGDKIATTWTWRRAQVWEELKNKYAKYSPERGYSEALWSLRNNVLARRYAYVESTFFACTGLKRLSKRHRCSLLRYMIDFDRGMKMPSGVEPVTWELPDGTRLQMGKELSECTEILWRTAPDYVKGSDRHSSWRQRRTGQINRRQISSKERQTKASKMLNANLTKVPLCDLPRRSGNSSSQGQERSIGSFNEEDEEDEDVVDPNMTRDFSDIAGALLESYHKCSDHSVTGMAVRRNLIKNTVYTGGTTMHSGFEKRALYELRSVAGDNAKDLKFCSTEEPLFATYKGASLLANSSFRDSTAMISKAEYEEKGCGFIAAKWAF
jgi:actin-related protein